MKNAEVKASTGLLFRGEADLDVARAANCVSDLLENHCLMVEAVKFWSETSVQIRANTLDLWLVLHHGSDAATPSKGPSGEDEALHITYLSLNQTPRLDRAPAGDMCQATLNAHLLRALQKELSADFVKWNGPFDILSAREFMRITRPLDQADQIVRVQSSRPAPDAAHLTGDAAQVALTLAISSKRFDHDVQQVVAWSEAPQDQERLRTGLRSSFQELPVDEAVQQEKTDYSEPTAPLRCSAWIMSVSVAIFCLPTGCALFVINALRGANLRLASQTAALSGTFMALQSSGSMAQAAHTLQGLLT